jgi:hypothetical protein
MVEMSVVGQKCGRYVACWSTFWDFRGAGNKATRQQFLVGIRSEFLSSDHVYYQLYYYEYHYIIHTIIYILWGEVHFNTQLNPAPMHRGNTEGRISAIMHSYISTLLKKALKDQGKLAR